MPQGVTRSNRVLENISKDQDLVHATREFCAILAHRQRRSKSEIAKFKELPGNLLVTKKCRPASQLWKELFSSAMIQWLKLLLSDAAEVPCAGPWDCGWEAGPEAAAGDGVVGFCIVSNFVNIEGVIEFLSCLRFSRNNYSIILSGCTILIVSLNDACTWGRGARESDWHVWP